MYWSHAMQIMQRSDKIQTNKKRKNQEQQQQQQQQLIKVCKEL